jgi:CRISPR/Cas system CSM-associated protein Csm2 small subunit
MFETFAFFTLIFSFLGISVIVWRKIPVLSALPEEKKESFFQRLKRKLAEKNPFKKFSLEVFLQRVIFPIRILILKLDNLTFNWLRKLREKYQEKKKREKDNYWEEIKKEIK